jgi:hypothetical protein
VYFRCFRNRDLPELIAGDGLLVSVSDIAIFRPQCANTGTASYRAGTFRVETKVPVDGSKAKRRPSVVSTSNVHELPFCR